MNKEYNELKNEIQRLKQLHYKNEDEIRVLKKKTMFD